jgi:hypothetical protein
MGNANIDNDLKKEVEELLQSNPKYRAKYQNLKGFIDNAVLELLEKIKKQNKEKN